MKLSSVLTCLVAGAATAAAFPAENSLQMAADVVTSKVKWTGQVKPGEPNITIVGTAQEIYEQLIVLNPNYDDELGINSVHTSVNRRALEPIGKRDTTSNDWTCGYGNDVTAELIGEDVRYMYRIGNADCAAPPGSPGAGGCANTACANGAGIWLCNDSSSEAHIPCSIIADNAVEVLIYCQWTTYGNGGWSTATHGQIFSRDRKWNVILNRC